MSTFHLPTSNFQLVWSYSWKWLFFSDQELFKWIVTMQIKSALKYHEGTINRSYDFDFENPFLCDRESLKTDQRSCYSHLLPFALYHSPMFLMGGNSGDSNVYNSRKVQSRKGWNWDLLNFIHFLQATGGQILNSISTFTSRSKYSRCKFQYSILAKHIVIDIIR